MSHIYWELHEIPKPTEAYINHSDGRVFLISQNGRSGKKRQVIGRATSETMMHPNDLFKFLYPALWGEHYSGSKLPEHVLNVGLYALSLGIGYKTGLYPLLIQTYGPLYANMIMDYAVYSILERSDVSLLYPDRMSREVLFSKDAYSDSWISDFFRTKMSEDANHKFKSEWLKECNSRGITNAWISIDGSNNDCSAVKSDLPQKGDAKSHKNIPVVSYIYAVNAEDGYPISYFVNNGSVVDSKAFQELAEFLSSASIKIEGVILDRGFCTHDVIQKIMDSGYQYVVMMKSDTHGHTDMMTRHADGIRWNVRCCANNKGLFGIQEKVRLFKTYPEEANVSLYFDGANGSARSITLVKNVKKAAKEVWDQIVSGKKPAIPPDMKRYLSVTEENGTYCIVYNYDAWQKDMDGKGYSSIASSSDANIGEIDRIYHLRDASETQYSIMKSQLGCDVTRVHYTEGIENKLAVCFVASIIRSEIMIACQKLDLDTNRMVREIDRISLVLMTDGTYAAINNLTCRQEVLLAEFGIRGDSFKSFAEEVNHRMVDPINSQTHTLPDHPHPSKKRGRPPKSKENGEAPEPGRKPGRPKGSKNKKTLLQEAETVLPSQGTCKRGRPKGSKNKPKSLETQPVKRKRGRPRKPGHEKSGG